MDINIPTLVSQTITNGVTAFAPSEDVVFDALALKANASALSSYQPLDADLTSIAGLSSTSAYLRRSAANTYVLDSYTTVAGNMPTTSITAKLLTGGTFTGDISATDSILTAFQTIDSNMNYLANAVVPTGDPTGSTLLAGKIIIGNATNFAETQTLTLSGTGGTFSLGATGILTMPNADTSTRGLLTSTDWNTFNGKGNAFTSGTLAQFASTTSAQLRGVLSDENGTGVALFDSATSPTFLTDITTPKIIGGTGATSKITNTASTHATPTATAVAHEWYRGNTGSTLGLTMLHNGSGGWGASYAETVNGVSVSGHLQYKVTNGSGIARLTAEGSTYGIIDIVATGSSANVRRGTLYTSGGYVYLQGVDDSGTATGHFMIGNIGTGDVAVGHTNASARFHIIKTTEQLRVGYDTSNYYKTTVSSAGAVTFDAVGASAGFSFADAVTLSDVNLVLGTTTGSKIGTATTQKLGFWNVTPIVQPAHANQAAVATTGATNVTPYGFTTAAQADGIITLLNEIRLQLVNVGIIKGSA